MFSNPYPLLSTLKPMKKQNKSTKKLNSSSESFVIINKIIGQNYSPLPNLPITSEPTVPQDTHHSKSGMASNQNSFPRSTSPPTSHPSKSISKH